MKIDDSVNALIDKLFETMVARAPRRPSAAISKVPECDRVILPFVRMRKRWKKREPIPSDIGSFAQVLKAHGVYVFAVAPGHIECENAHNKIAKALGS